MVRRMQSPVNEKLPPPLMAMPPARGLKPKFPAAETRQKTRSVNNSPREKPLQGTRSVDNPPRERPQQGTRSVDNQPREKTRSVDTPPLKPVEKLGVGRKAVPPSGKIVTPNLKMFTLEELKTATKNFRPESMIGEGGFGQVFKGWVEEKTLAPSRVGVGIPVAVKKSDPDSAQGLHEWQASNSKCFSFFLLPNLLNFICIKSFKDSNCGKKLINWTYHICMFGKIGKKIQLGVTEITKKTVAQIRVKIYLFIEKKKQKKKL